MPDDNGKTPPHTGPAARFSRLEMPHTQIDWSFLDLVERLPRPLPTEDLSLWIALDGRLWVPSREATDDGDVLRLYDRSRRLTLLDIPHTIEQRWHQERASALSEARRQWMARVPTELLQQPALLQQAIDQLAAPNVPPPDRDKILAAGVAHEDGSHWLSVVGYARICALQEKLYNLVTLREYAAIFSRALSPDLVTALARLPLTAGPDAFLEIIERKLDEIHPKARSPLRNKMSTSCVRISGVTLLPIYLGPRSGLYDRYAQRLWRSVAHETLRARVSPDAAR